MFKYFGAKLCKSPSAPYRRGQNFLIFLYGREVPATIQKLRLHWFFDSDFHKFASVGGGGSAPRTPYKCIFPNFLNFCPTFRQKFDRILKKFEKFAKFSSKFFKNCKFFIDFLQLFWKLLRRPGALPPEAPPPTRRPPLQALPWWTSLPPEKKFLRALMLIWMQLFYTVYF